MGLPDIKAWLGERWPFASLWHMLVDEEIPGGARYAYSFGSSILILFSLQALTGIVQMFFYVPSVQEAYNSVSYIRTEVPFGWLMHGLHYWGAQVMLVLVLLHITQVFLWGAYKRPRELTWLFGTALLVTMMGFSFTGSPLHWDQRGFWAGEVGTSIAGVVPLIGDAQKVLLRGAEEMGQLSITRFFGLHVAVLPAALLGIFLFHIVSVRRMGSAGPWDEDKRKTTGPFWPDQVFKDAVAGSLVFFLLLALVVFLPPEYTGQADRLDTSFVPKPEWNFLFLYESLKYFQGPLEPIGAAGVPGLIIFLFVVLPFIDRKAERNPFRRPVAMICGFLLAATVVALSVVGYMSPGYGYVPEKEQSVKTAKDSSLATIGHLLSPRESAAAEEHAARASEEESRLVFTAGDPERGSELFKQYCAACHGPDAKGGMPNPGASHGPIPGLNPAHGHLYSDDPRIFAWNIFMTVTNGRAQAGAAIQMPAFAGTIPREGRANIVSYILKMNGVDVAALPAWQPETPPVPARVEEEQARAQPPHDQAIKEARELALVAPEEREPGRAAFVIGSRKDGARLFALHCASCHGEEGRGGVPNPGSARGSVPSLNPIRRDLHDEDPGAFAVNVDRLLQYGRVPEGPAPALVMPAFGETNALTQQQISNIIAYVMELNGVDRAKLLNPGMEPKTFFLVVTAAFLLSALSLGGLRERMKKNR
jgi:ubiquinol-cytochrome c reductase cytochrome b subunit